MYSTWRRLPPCVGVAPAPLTDTPPAFHSRASACFSMILRPNFIYLAIFTEGSVTAVLYIIPLITQLLANKKENLSQGVFLQFICYHSLCYSAEKYSSPNRRRFSSPSSLSSLFLFLTSDDNAAFCQELKSSCFPRIFKLI